jgi:hypothetical protein
VFFEGPDGAFGGVAAVAVRRHQLVSDIIDGETILQIGGCRVVESVNPSGKASAQIPQLPLGDNSSPLGDNTICTGAHTGYTAGSAKSLSATYQYKISNTSDKLLANKNLTNN